MTNHQLRLQTLPSPIVPPMATLRCIGAAAPQENQLGVRHLRWENEFSRGTLTASIEVGSLRAVDCMGFYWVLRDGTGGVAAEHSNYFYHARRIS
jgi:hypothetical protein